MTTLQATVGDGDPRATAVTRTARGTTVWIEGTPYRVWADPDGRGYDVTVEDRTERVWIAVDRDVVHVHAFGRSWSVELVDPVQQAAEAGDQANTAQAPMPGTIVTVAVAPGDRVASGQPLVVIESMKMESQIVAWRDGVVDRVHRDVGETFDRGADLIGLVPEEQAEAS